MPLELQDELDVKRNRRQLIMSLTPPKSKRRKSQEATEKPSSVFGSPRSCLEPFSGPRAKYLRTSSSYNITLGCDV